MYIFVFIQRWHCLSFQLLRDLSSTSRYFIFPGDVVSRDITFPVTADGTGSDYNTFWRDKDTTLQATELIKNGFETDDCGKLQSGHVDLRQGWGP